MLIQDRIKLIVKANNLTSSEFADRIGIKRSNLSHVLNGRNKPGLDFLSKVVTTFPNVNASWLLTGEQRDGDFKEEVMVDDTVKTTPTKRGGDSVQLTDRIVVLRANGTFKEYLPSEE
jgi:transcriptional regulator with XRE-family HTH domain